MLPAHQQDVWNPATETEKIQALVMLSGLPSRATSAGELDNAAYLTALDGTTRYGLAEAVKAILKGSLGHGFMPSPPELRIEHDKAMRWHEDMAAKIRRRERENEGFARDSSDGWRPPTPEEKARVAALMAEFNASHDAAKNADFEAERAEIRARYGMTDEALAALPGIELQRTWNSAAEASAAAAREARKGKSQAA